MDKTTLILCRHGLYLPSPTGLKKLSNLEELESKIQSKKVDVLVGPNLSYLENLKLPSNKSGQEKEIEKYLKASLPDDEIADSWTVETISKNKTEHQLRVFALETDFFMEFTSVLKERKITVRSYASLALSVAKLISDSRPHVIIFIQNDIYFLIAQIGEQIFTKSINQLHEIKTDIANFLTFLEENGQNKIEALYSYSDRDLSKLGLSLVDVKINFHQLKTYFSIPSSVITKPTKNKPKLIWFVLILSLIAIMTGIAWIYFTAQTANNNPTPSPTPSPITANPSPLPVDLTTISVQVFNGTTIGGYAGKIANTIKEAGYTKVETGNYKQNTYKKNTLVVSDPLLSENFIKILPELNLEVVSEEVTNLTATKSASLFLIVPSED